MLYVYKYTKYPRILRISRDCPIYAVCVLLLPQIIVGLCLHSPCSEYMDERTCWLPLNPVSHVVIILTLCFTAHTALSPSSLDYNNLTDGCTEALCTLIMSVKSLTKLWSVPPQLYSTPAVFVLWDSMHVAQCSAY